MGTRLESIISCTKLPQEIEDNCDSSQIKINLQSEGRVSNKVLINLTPHIENSSIITKSKIGGS